MTLRPSLILGTVGLLVLAGCESQIEEKYEEHDTTGIPEQTPVGADGGLGSPGVPGQEVTIGDEDRAGEAPDGLIESDLGYPVEDDRAVESSGY